ncbi:uncharacterized protein LOC114357028 [Ostrinia furnacalis]|uniref:uncharacterized protein LOC114357028 n=1 Tax=Ostrinia furnacalis TaxID=93504 RepID=UPI00103FEE2F|nr:uncharacterized protein LOC114357028 [Ostrinia furnacalis]
MKTCAACNDTVLHNDCLECTRCSEAYHYLCLNYTVEEIQSLDNEVRKYWLCPKCKNKQPKGDNSNMLVRPSTPTGMAEVTFNVTRRKAHNRPESTQSSTGYVTRADIRLIMREEMRSVMNEFADDLKGTMNVRLREVSDQLAEVRTSMGFLSDQFDSLKSDIDSHGTKIKQLETVNNELRSELITLSNRVRQMDQMSRSSNLELQCVPEHRSENVISVIKQLGHVINHPINDCDILYCSRIAKSNPNSSRPRSILVKFATPRTRDSVLAASIQYNKTHQKEKLNTSVLGLDDKRSPVYVVENLTVENKSLHAAARLRAKQLSFKYVWVRGGRVYVRKSDTSEAVFIRDLDTLNNLK